MQATKMKKKPEGGSIDVHKPAHNGNARAPVQFSKLAKDKLDHVKQAENLATYNEVVDFLYRMWRRNEPSMAGAFPGIGPFVREDDDPNRVPY
jgi:hypothetical protein